MQKTSSYLQYNVLIYIQPQPQSFPRLHSGVFCCQNWTADSSVDTNPNLWGYGPVLSTPIILPDHLIHS